MPFRYDPPPTSGQLRQGEILGDLWFNEPEYPPIEIPEGKLPTILGVEYPLLIVMTADCDLEWDFKARFPDEQSQAQYQTSPNIEDSPKLITHVLFCSVFEKGKIRPRFTGMRAIWTRIQQNQDERYHHFKPASVDAPPSVNALEDLYLDFKKTPALSVKTLYDGFRTGEIRRVAIVPSPYIYDLTHRFFGFLSRVGLPD